MTPDVVPEQPIQYERSIHSLAPDWSDVLQALEPDPTSPPEPQKFTPYPEKIFRAAGD